MILMAKKALQTYVSEFLERVCDCLVVGTRLAGLWFVHRTEDYDRTKLPMLLI